MNGPFFAPQATGTPVSPSGGPRVVRITKPADHTTQTVQLSYDQSVKLDLSAVASEKITLVHIGERLIIVFDNSSTITVQPFFDSMGVPLSNISVESGGNDLSGA